MALNYAALLPLIERLGSRVEGGLQIVPASEVLEEHYPRLDPDRPVLLAGIGLREDARDAAEILMQVYGGEHEVLFVKPGREEPVTLAGLATAFDWGEEAAVFVPPLRRPGAYTALQDVVARLRAPDGCPWDRELTWAKLRSFLLEETYELLAALDAEDPAKVAEEQGDVLLQLALQQQIAVEEGKFRAGDVIAGIVEKLIRRHPHVFGDAVVSGTDEVLANWEAIKRVERAENGGGRSPLAGVPAGLPALAQAEAYLDRISRIDAVDVPEIPCAELAEAVTAGRDVTPDMLGRALFGLVAWARARGLEPESSLRSTNAAYARRVART